MSWFFYFVTAFIVSATIQGCLILARKKYFSCFGWWHRLGGVGMIVGFVGSIWVNPELVITPAIWMILIGTVTILVFGVIDDVIDLSWKWQLLFQIGLGLSLVAVSVEIPYLTNPWGGMIPLDGVTISLVGITLSVISSIIILFWTVGVMNAINWADGIDGLAGMIGMVTMAAIALISQRPEVNQPAITILSLITLGAILGFWVWNIHPALIEAGTSGSFFMGWIIATLAIIAGTKVATTLIVVAVPLVDAVWVIGERLMAGHAITQRDADSRHLHYRLRTLGWNDPKIVMFYTGFLVFMISIQYFFDQPMEKLILMIVVGLILIGVLFYVRRRVKSLPNL